MEDNEVNEVREVIEVREDIEVKKLGRTRSQGIETFSTQILKSSNSQINQNPKPEPICLFYNETFHGN